jgi:PAS domain S-box-containing protein
VTEQRQAETALRESEERWRRISEATSEGIGFSDKGVMFDVNERLAEMLGYRAAELIGMAVADCVAPEDRPRVAQAARAGLESAYEHRALRKDGSTFPVEVRARWLTLQGRRVRVAAIRDLSERTRLETELRRRERLAAMGSLVAAVAHEVRTPLFSLSATLDTLEAGMGTPAEQQELRELLRSQLRRLSALMQDLLDYGRPPRLRLAPGAIRSPIERAVRSCEAQAARAGVRIALDVPDGLPQLALDPQRLEQVFENLVTNACQHSPRGAAVEVQVAPAEAPRRGLLCRVLDRGPGLGPAELDHLFEPFFSRRRGGTGMGLAIAQRYVEAHGGSLTAANRAGGGAEFVVYLPAERGAEAGGAVA